MVLPTLYLSPPSMNGGKAHKLNQKMEVVIIGTIMDLISSIHLKISQKMCRKMESIGAKQ
jgi:hypothetical protein